MKHLLLISVLIIGVLSGCSKEENPQVEGPDYHQNPEFEYFYAWFKGTITDSLGNNVSDLILRNNSMWCMVQTTVVNGNYGLKACRRENLHGSEGTLGYPSTISVSLLDSSFTYLDTFEFDSNLLIENDTIIINFQQ